MTLHPDVIRDLLPLYLAGEASPATRDLVEQHLAADPELARLAQTAARDDERRARVSREVAVPVTVEKTALRTTRRLLRRRSRLLGLAIAFTVLPFSFSFDGHELRLIFFEGSPWFCSLVLTAAAGLWIAYWWVSRRLRVTGL